MTNTDILLEDLEDVLDDATSMPMTKKSLVDVDKIKTIIEDIRLNTPQETKQAKAIVDSRNNILDEAKKEAAKIISEAQAQARELVARDQITQNAQKEATEIIAKAHSEGEAYVKQAQNQASELLGKAQRHGLHQVDGQTLLPTGGHGHIAKPYQLTNIPPVAQRLHMICHADRFGIVQKRPGFHIGAGQQQAKMLVLFQQQF